MDAFKQAVLALTIIGSAASAEETSGSDQIGAIPEVCVEQSESGPTLNSSLPEEAKRYCEFLVTSHVLEILADTLFNSFNMP
jgi:hypothetical protein